ncbi:SpoIIE family protein phosphatase [Streptomyces capparidis]
MDGDRCGRDPPAAADPGAHPRDAEREPEQDAAVDAALTAAVRDTGASAGLVYVLPPGEAALSLVVLSGVSLEIAVPWTKVAVDAPIPVADAVRERRLVWLGSREEMARRYPRPALVLPYDFALAAAPLVAGDAVLGGLVLLWPGWHPPLLAPHERVAVDVACERVGRLLKRAADAGHPVLPGPRTPRALSPPRRHAVGPAEAMAAVDFAERLPGGCCALDAEGRVVFVTTEAAELLGADVGDLLGARPRQALPWLDDPVTEDRYRAAVISRSPTSFTVLRPPDRWLSFRLFADDSGVSVRITPVGAEDAVEDLERVAHPQVPGRATALYHLMHLAATLTEAIGVSDVVDRVADQLMPAFGVRAMALMTAGEGRLRIIGHRGYPEELMRRFDAVPLGSDTPAAHVLATGVPCFFAGFDELKRAHPPAVHQDGMAAWAFLPLIASGRPVGSLVLAYERRHSFAPDERAVLTSVAGLVAQALDRARLYDAKHHLARSLQAGLLPRTLPDVPGLEVAARYLPASRGMDIGGDFYDLIRLGAHDAAAAIGDVQGHNVSAAALMGQVRTAVHATAGASPGEVLTRTNRLLTDLDPGLFTSCLYAHLDLARHRARLATAGHPPPLLRRPGGRTEVLHLPPGLLLGIDPDADYPTAQVPLPPGAVLALYTDGLVESPGVDLEDALAALARRLDAAAHEPLDVLADILVRHAAGPAQNSDDVALLLIRPRGGG